MEIQSFRKFESKNTQKITVNFLILSNCWEHNGWYSFSYYFQFQFDKLERDDKIDRVFVTLSMFVQLFEADLALWTLK